MTNGFAIITILLLICNSTPKISNTRPDTKASGKIDYHDISVSIVVTEDCCAGMSVYQRLIFSERFKRNFGCRYTDKVDSGTSTPLDQYIVACLKELKCFKRVFANNADSSDILVSIHLKGSAFNTESSKAVSPVNKLNPGFSEIPVDEVEVNKLKTMLSYSINYGTIYIRDIKKEMNLPTVKFRSSGKFPITTGTDCDTIYDHLNAILKYHNDSFVELIVSKIDEYIKAADK